MRWSLAVFTAAMLTASAGAQGAVAPAASASPTAAVPDPYAYRTEGRRDPFVSLVGTGVDLGAASKRGDGPAGFLLGEISVRGVMQAQGALVAMIQGPDNKTYLIHQGEKLADGVVKSITPQGLVVVQDVSDPLSVQKQREVRKLLRSLEDAK